VDHGCFETHDTTPTLTARPLGIASTPHSAISIHTSQDVSTYAAVIDAVSI
jgi:hypothetical protein